jgi:hypothetical protein
MVPDVSAGNALGWTVVWRAVAPHPDAAIAAAVASITTNVRMYPPVRASSKKARVVPEE